MRRLFGKFLKKCIDEDINIKDIMLLESFLNNKIRVNNYHL